MSVHGRSLLPWLRLGGAAVAVAAAVHIAPGVTWLPPVRNHLAPTLGGRGRAGHLALTFDDGPDADGTPAVLAALQDLGWRATFFMLGEQVRARPRLAAEVAQAGHEVALHGDAHRYLLARSPRDTRQDLVRGLATVATVCGERPQWFRPPYGVLTTGALLALRDLDVRPVLWTAWGRDWVSGATPRRVVDTLHRGILDGGTVLLHDSDVAAAPCSWRTTVAALPLLAEVAAGQGLAVGPVGEHGVGAGAGRAFPSALLDRSARTAPAG
jgi:peptidoglycan-N-acetylglucosamine deacetylase